MTTKAKPQKKQQKEVIPQTNDCSKARNLVANMALFETQKVTVGHVKNFQRYLYDYAMRVQKQFITDSDGLAVEVFRKK